MTTDERVRAIRRRAASSRAAYALHAADPDAARRNGAKGGAARVAQIADKRAYMSWVARKRWIGELAGPPPC